jgi:hypothetical protein
VPIVGLWQLLTPPVGVNRHCGEYNNTGTQAYIEYPSLSIARYTVALEWLEGTPLENGLETTPDKYPGKSDVGSRGVIVHCDYECII